MSNIIEPIKKIEDVNRLRRKLSRNPRDLLLFCLLTETGLRLKDVLHLRVKDLDGLKVGDPLPVPKAPTNRVKKPIVTKRITESFHMLRKAKPALLEDFLFKSRKRNAPLEPPSVSRLVAQWFKQEKLVGLTGVKSLRKTWEYHFEQNADSEDIETKSGEEGIYGRLLAPKMSDQIYSILLDLILTGRLAPGQRMIAHRIAAEMNVSAMPVRDALNRLEANGFIILGSNRSYYVASLSKKDLIEITDLRMILEPLAAVKASKTASPEEIGEIVKIAHIFQKAVDHEAKDTYIKINRKFHFKIYSCTKNKKMINFIEQLWNMLSPYQYLLSQKSRSYNFAEGGYRNHQEIISALKSGDKESLEYWIRQDITFAFNGIMAEFFDTPN